MPMWRSLAAPTATIRCARATRRPAPSPFGAASRLDALKVVDLLADVRVRELAPDELEAFDPDGLAALQHQHAGRPGARRTRRLARPAAHGRSPIVDSGSKPSQTSDGHRHHDSAHPGSPSRPRHRRRAAAVRPAAPSDLPPVPIAYPAQPRRWATSPSPLAFELARRLRKAPRVIGQEIAAALGDVPGVARVECAANGYLNVFLDRPAFLADRLAGRVGAAARRRRAREDHRRAHRHQPEQGGAHRPPPQRRAGRHAGAGAALPRPPGRDPELHRRHRRAGGRRGRRLPPPRAARRSPTSRRSPREPRFDYYCWDLYARVTEWYDAGQGAADDARGHAPRHRARRGRGGRHRPPRRRPHRPLPPEDDGAAERAVRPADVGRRHPAAAVLGPGVRAPEGAGHRLLPGQRPAGRLLGHAHRGRATARRREARRRRPPSPRPTASRGGRPRRGRPGREGHRAVQRHGDLRRQGHGVPVLEVRPARRGLPLPPVRRRGQGRPALGDHVGRRRRTSRPSGRPSAAATRSTT